MKIDYFLLMFVKVWCSEWVRLLTHNIWGEETKDICTLVRMYGQTSIHNNESN